MSHTSLFTQEKLSSSVQTLTRLVSRFYQQNLDSARVKELLMQPIFDDKDVLQSSFIFLEALDPVHITLKKQLMSEGRIDMMITLTPNGEAPLQGIRGDMLCFLLPPDQAPQTHFLLLNTYHLYQPLNLRLKELTEEQIQNIFAVICLYKQADHLFLKNIHHRLSQLAALMGNKPFELREFLEIVTALLHVLHELNKQLYKHSLDKQSKAADFKSRLQKLTSEVQFFKTVLIENTENSLTALENVYLYYHEYLKSLQEGWSSKKEENWENLLEEERLEVNKLQNQIASVFLRSSEYFEDLSSHVSSITRACKDLIAFAELELLNTQVLSWDKDKVDAVLECLYEEKEAQRMRLEELLYYFEQVQWLQKRFPQAELRDLPGFCKITNRNETEQREISLSEHLGRLNVKA